MANPQQVYNLLYSFFDSFLTTIQELEGFETLDFTAKIDNLENLRDQLSGTDDQAYAVFDPLIEKTIAYIQEEAGEVSPDKIDVL